MANTRADKPVDNGVNVEALFGAQAALKEAPEAALSLSGVMKGTRAHSGAAREIYDDCGDIRI